MFPMAAEYTPGGDTGWDDAWWADDSGASGDPGHSPVRRPGHPAFRPDPFGNEDARRLGLDRNTIEGAQVHFASSLDSSKASHRAVAWTILFLMFGLPLLLQVLQFLRH